MNVKIRPENKNDYHIVENLIRESFWNLYVPGCDEHYLAHILRNHSDFIPELNFVALLGEELVGSIMYARSYIINEEKEKLDTVGFGPVCVAPQYQRQGIGTALIEYSRSIAVKMGFKVMIILGHPHNYCKHGFKSCRDFNVADINGRFPFGQLVLELEHGILQGHNWKFIPSAVYDIDSQAAEKFDAHFPRKEKKYLYSQEEFSIACRAFLN